MEDIVPGFNAYQNSLLEKMMEPLNEFSLCALKIQQLKNNKASSRAISEVFDVMLKSKDRIYEILSKELSKA